MLAAACTGLDALDPICQAGSLGGSVVSSGFESVLDGISQWVASGAEWLLDQIGNVLSAGDLIILLGAFILLHVTCRSRLAAPGAASAKIPRRDARGSTAGI